MSAVKWIKVSSFVLHITKKWKVIKLRCLAKFSISLNSVSVRSVMGGLRRPLPLACLRRGHAAVFAVNPQHRAWTVPLRLPITAEHKAWQSINTVFQVFDSIRPNQAYQLWWHVLNQLYTIYPRGSQPGVNSTYPGGKFNDAEVTILSFIRKLARGKREKKGWEPLI